MGDTKDKIKQIYEALPQLNCGQCGFEGCGQFAKAVAEGRASPFGCRQNPWAGYRIREIIGEKTPITGSPGRFAHPAFGHGGKPSASIGSLREEVGELSKRVEGIIGRINSLERKEAIGMPRAAAAGAAGGGPGIGWGLGRGGGRGRMGGGGGFGIGGECVCPNCGYRVAHQRSTPCYQVRCPNCGSPMAR
jgi:hypothetical protein